MRQGKQALAEIVQRLGELADQGRPVAILWDMDGTLVDTRPRMLAAVHTYGRTDVRVTDVSPSWQETAERLGLDPERFQAVWQRVFWAYESFDADLENEEVAGLARLAESLGVQTVIVTGRIEELRPVTARQLERLGLSPTRVFLKSRLGDCTPSVKAEVISMLAAEGLQMGAFVTDSVEEIAAVTPDILEAAPDLSCVFVELEGTAPDLPDSVHRFPAPFRNGPGMAAPAEGLEVEGGWMEFGYEAEYEIERADSLLLLYDPTPESGISTDTWRGWSAEKRAEWVYSLFPDPHSEEFDLPLARNERLPRLDFLPEGLFVDSDGNIEVVSQPTRDLRMLWRQLELLERELGPGLLQVTVSVPAEPYLGSPEALRALDGFLTFHHFLDGFERLAVGRERYQENPDREVLLPFLHSWLGPLTAGKHRFLRQYLEANARGERLEEKWVRLVDRAFSSFKYINGTAYRPGLAGRDRLALEIRDAHRNRALLAQRVSRVATCLLSGLLPYEAFARTWAFDSETDYEALPEKVRQMLETVVPSRVRPEIDFMYSDYDRVALQVYRNFALPVKDYSDLSEALADGEGTAAIEAAGQAYLGKLQAMGDRLGSESPEVLLRALQGALAAFAVESGLARRFQAFSERALSSESAAEAARRVQAFLPLTKAQLPRAWRGALQQRLATLAERHPTQARLLPEVSFQGLDGKVSTRPLLLLSVRDLADAQAADLTRGYLRAVSRHSLGLRTTDRGSLDLRFGRYLYAPGRWSAEDVPFQPFAVGAGPELLLKTDGPEAYRLGRRLAAHKPSDESARRVSASGWLRHLPLGPRGSNLESDLQLPYPESIETAAQVFDRVLGHSSDDRLSAVVMWTAEGCEDWLARHSSFGQLRVKLQPSTLESGFPGSLRCGDPLEARLQALVARWPDHARLVPEVPFAFNQQSQLRTVLVLALHGLDDDEFERFRVDYLNTVGADTISFPCRSRAEHLRTRVGHLALALSAEGVRVDFYEPPWRRRRMEAMVELLPEEVDRLRRYLGAVVDNTLGLLGPITLGAACRTSEGRLDGNLPTDGGRHNCTSWVTLAPLSPDGRNLAQLVQMPDSWHSHDNPGWWSMFLTGASRSPRTHTVVYWTDLPLDQDPCRSGVPIEWDFNPH